MRIADLSLREDPTNDRTVDALLASGWTSGWQRPLYAAIAEVAVSVRGDPRPSVRVGAMVPTWASSSANEIQYGQSEKELRGTLLGLVTAGFEPRAIAVGDAPDGLVNFDHDTVWVEHAEVVDPVSARYSNMMWNLSRDVKDDVAADASAVGWITGQHVEIRIGLCPSKSQVSGVRQELLEMFRNGTFMQIPERTMGRAPGATLEAIDARVYRVPWAHGATGGSPYILHIQDAAHSFGPLSLVPIALRRLEVKRRLGVTYGVTPLWLVLSVTDLRGVWDESMALLGSGCPPIAPYERVILCDPGRAIIWANGVMALRDVRTR